MFVFFLPQKQNQAPNAHVNSKVTTKIEWDGQGHGVWNKPVYPIFGLIMLQQIVHYVNKHSQEKENDSQFRICDAVASVQDLCTESQL